MTMYEAWAAEALCAETDPELFFPNKGQSPRRAKEICGVDERGNPLPDGCPVRQQCLKYALTHPNPLAGIWGGTTEDERKPLRKGMPKRPEIMHGTEAGSRQHYRLGEKPCWACAEATRQQSRLRRAKCSA